jgi:hypothetical protein
MTICATDGCHNRARWIITKGDQTKQVCGSCRDELAVLHGWHFKTTVKV